MWLTIMTNEFGYFTLAVGCFIILLAYSCYRLIKSLDMQSPTTGLSKFQLQVLTGVTIGVSIISAYLLFSGRTIFDISRFDWLFTNCEEFAKTWSGYDDYYLGENLWQGQEYQDEAYGGCRDAQFEALVNSSILIASVSTAIIASYFLQQKSTGDIKSSEIEKVSSQTPSSTNNDETDSSDIVNGKVIPTENPIQKPTKTSQISPIGPIEFDTEGYEWSTDKYERPIYRTAGSADHWEIWEQ